MSQPQPVVIQVEDCPLESWSAESAALVQWRTLFSADRTPTRGLTLGVTELPPRAADEPVIAHRHEPAEIYYVLGGEGVVYIDGTTHPLRAGSAVYVPSGSEHVAVNTGSETLRLLYVFAADDFSKIDYEFTGTRSIA